MRMLIAAAMVVAGFLPALADETSCERMRALLLREGAGYAQSIGGFAGEVTDADAAQRVGDMILSALGKPSQPVASIIVVGAPDGTAIVALHGPDSCYVVGTAVPLDQLTKALEQAN